MSLVEIPLDPQRDLAFERLVDLPAAALWAAWTTPELLLPWFCPKPWQTIACDIDLRPGGRFATTMQSPEGALFPNAGCYLEIVPERRLAWTNALEPGFRPADPQSAENFFYFTGIVELEPRGAQTLYRAIVRHGTAVDCQKHAAMGFQEGWGMALDQLIEFMKGRQG